MISEAYDYHQSGFRIFPLWSIEPNGKCECGDPNCGAVGKHPRISNWPSVPHWSDEQLETLQEFQINTGFGVALDDHLVIDIDKRNGGFESYVRLCKYCNVDFESVSDFVVHTGGSGLHIYFSRPSGAFAGKLDGYVGIDFKSSGYLVGAGSYHASGSQYEYKKGFPDAELAPCPQVLLDMLEKKTHKRTIFEGRHVDVSLEEVVDMVKSINNEDLHYDDFIEIGMAIHQATNGEGFFIWDEWAQKSAKYQPDQMSYKWHSFGKSSNPVTIGTLIYHAEQNGYVKPVTFAVGEDEPKTVYESAPGELPFDASAYDPKRPPGFVGKLAQWMNGNSYDEPLEHLTTISSIAAVGNIVGLHTTDDLTDVSTNLLVLCIAESASGKESVNQSYAKIMEASGMSGALAGAIKSKQEICRNLIEHQAAFYLIDEMGEVLRTIENAKKRGGAAYLEGVTGEIMSIFTKASGTYSVSGDTRRDLVAVLQKEIAQIENRLSSGSGSQSDEELIERKKDAIKSIQTVGIVRPFLSLIGYSVSASMDSVMTPEMAMNGFLSRALLAIEEKDNPKPVKGSIGMRPIPETYVNTLRYLASTGSFSMDSGPHRLEFYGERKKIKTTPEAKALLDRLRDWQWEYAEHHRETSGFTPLIRRSWELISKISTILAAPGGIREREHVEWAAMYVKRDIDRKIRHIRSAQARESKDVETVQDGIEARIINLCDRDEGESLSVIINKCKRKDIKRSEVEALVIDMVARNILQCVRTGKLYKGDPVVRYKTI